MSDESIADEKKCSKCPEEKKFFCADCQESFCTACTVRLHHPATVNDTHSLEEIDWNEDRGVHVLSSLSDELLIVLIVWTVFCLPFDIPKDYVLTPTICPLLGNFQHWLAVRDAGGFYLLKQTLLQYCGMEDSLWRFYGDFWVRGIVTNTDTLFILLHNGMSVAFSEFALWFIVSPIIAFFYAVIFTVVYKLESFIPRTPFFEQVERYAGYINVTDFFEVPPNTIPRKRKSTDWLDHITYGVQRTFRRPLHFFSSTMDVLQKLSVKAVGICFVLRLLCILFHAGSALRWFLQLLGLGKLMRKHEAWFGDQVSHEHLSDGFLWKALRTVYKGPATLGFMGGWSKLFFVLTVLVCVGLFMYKQHQREMFNQDWEAEGGGRDRVFGGRGGRANSLKTCRCVCVGKLKQS